MYADISKPPPPLPHATIQPITDDISLLTPLSRRGTGPGLVLVVPENSPVLLHPNGVPSLLQKWAEEGYVVAQITSSAFTSSASILSEDKPLQTAITAITGCEKYEAGSSIGLIVYDVTIWPTIAASLPAGIVATVVYADYAFASSLIKPSIPILHHISGGEGEKAVKSKYSTTYFYPQAKSLRFVDPLSSSFSYTIEAVSHTRTLTFLKGVMGGPTFDLEDIWEEHTFYEFADRSVEHTMSTMVEQPYVNHVPTMTGGIGRERLASFYRSHFIFNNSADTELELISRTVGIDRVIDEFIFKFTHDQEIDWILPGVPPTNKKVQIPFTAIVNFRGDRLYHEHIAWDQSSVLRQLGLLPEYLPFPYTLPDERKPADGKTFEYRLPVAGVETAMKLRDRESVPSNEMFGFSVREAVKKEE